MKGLSCHTPPHNYAKKYSYGAYRVISYVVNSGIRHTTLDCFD